MIRNFDVTKIERTYTDDRSATSDTLRFVYQGVEVRIRRRVKDGWRVAIDVEADGVYVGKNIEPTADDKHRWSEIENTLLTLDDKHRSVTMRAMLNRLGWD